MSYLTAAEFVRALADAGHVLAHAVDGYALGGSQEFITEIELQLSNGRTIAITADDGGQLLITELT